MHPGAPMALSGMEFVGGQVSLRRGGPACCDQEGSHLYLRVGGKACPAGPTLPVATARISCSCEYRAPELSCLCLLPLSGELIISH